MGCCVSAADRRDKNSGDSPAVSDKNRPPPPQPPAIVEEETVKEVLSETTTMFTSSNDEPVIDESKTQKKKPAMEEIRENEGKPEILKTAQIPTRPEPVDPNPEDGSEVSEICSLSMSESVSSTVVNPYEDGDDEVKQRKFQGIRQGSPAKPRNRVKGNNYPTRRPEQSPVKRNFGGTGSVRMVHPSPGRRSGSGTMDPAERSGRRSRSPATNRSVMSPGTGMGTGRGARRKNIESPGRVRMDPGKNESEQVSQWPSRGRNEGNDSCAPRESLENPLVSLECFIFL